MRMNWLATTAIALTLGTCPALAQSSTDHSQQKHDEKSRVEGAAGQRGTEHSAERAKERTTGQAGDNAGNREERQGETSSYAEHGKQAEEPSGRVSHESNRQSQEQPAKGEHTPSTAQEEKGRSSAAKQSQDQESARQGQKEGQKNEHAQDTNRPSDTKQTTEQEHAREGKKGEQAQETKQPSETKQSQQERDHGKEQAGQRTEPSTQQSGRANETNQQKQGENATQPTNQKQGENASQPTDQTNRRAEINDNQRKEISQKLDHEKTSMNQNVDIHVNVGERLPQRVSVRPLPPDIVSIAPQYRDYDYTVIDNRIAIVDPHSRDIVEYVDEGSGYGRSASNGEDRISFSDEEHSKWRDIIRHSSSTIGSTASSSSGSASCLSLQPVPEEMVRDHPELRNYRYLAIGDEAVLVDPQQKKIVQVID